MRRTPWGITSAVAAMAITISSLAWGQEQQAPESTGDVSREEHEQLRQAHEQLKADFELLKERLDAVESDPASREETEAYLQYLDEQLKMTRELAAYSRPGTSKFLIAGYATAGYVDREDSNSTFDATFNPLFLWKLGDRLLFESELEFELESGEEESETELELEYANITYIVNDYVTVGAGKFLTPFSIFPERLHPAWINKLPDAPLVFGHHGGLAPMSSLGAHVRGGVPLGSMKGNYAFYVSNGPTLEAEGHHAGSLDFDNFEDLNHNKAVGGRVGFLPIPQVEVSYSFQVSEVDPDGLGQEVDALLQGVDASLVWEDDAIGGAVDLRVEWVFSDVDDFTGIDEDSGEPFTINNNVRNGGYVQIAYRPTKNANDIIRNLEAVFRYDGVNRPTDLGGDEQRYTFGLNYWLGPSSVFKTAYQVHDRDQRDDLDAFLFQVAVGF